MDRLIQKYGLSGGCVTINGEKLTIKQVFIQWAAVAPLRRGKRIC